MGRAEKHFLMPDFSKFLAFDTSTDQLSLAVTDGVRKDATSFKTVCPYLNTPLPGNFNN